ncbi:hypothetical protein HGRIS_011315 [Hohenbuehelia grisea]|uniref:Rad51-like C-terminal domain-containing protein n=1 Tax=Hohenbuehelia grisea TaxID=104357 RepID=A0ABR3JUV0_9AGAR
MSSRPLASLSLPLGALSALVKAGYETVADLATASPEGLAEELRLSLDVAQRILLLMPKPSTVPSTPFLTQTAAHLAKGGRTTSKITTGSSPVDILLDGGLPRGHILEISGPPGSPKEVLATSIVKTILGFQEELIFVDMQNMTSPSTINKLSSNAKELVYYLKLHALVDVMIFIRNLSRYLAERPKVSLLVLNSLSFPFQMAYSLSPSAKSSLLDQIKQVLVTSCASRNICVVITSQLATKLVGPDGNPSNFDTSGSRGIMVPQLGPSYLPSGRSYRLILVPDGRDTGVVRLLSSPRQQPNNGRFRQEPYVLSA